MIFLKERMRAHRSALEEYCGGLDKGALGKRRDPDKEHRKHGELQLTTARQLLLSPSTLSGRWHNEQSLVDIAAARHVLLKSIPSQVRRYVLSSRAANTAARLLKTCFLRLPARFYFDEGRTGTLSAASGIFPVSDPRNAAISPACAGDRSFASWILAIIKIASVSLSTEPS